MHAEGALQTRRRLARETAIVYALFTLPGLALPTALTTVAFDGAVFAALALRNAAFALLVLYLVDLRGERGVVFGTPLGITKQMVLAVAITAGLYALAGAVASVADLVPWITRPTIVPWRVPTEFRQRLSFVAAMLAIGVTEEVLFRAYLMRRLQQLGLQSWRAVAVSALLFAAGHLYQGPTAFAFAALAGVALGLVWLRAPSIGAFAAGHAMYNTVVVLMWSAERGIA